MTLIRPISQAGRLYGRGRELDRLRAALEQARTGRGSAVMVWGDPGIGKTALLNGVVEEARDFLVLRCRGTRAEFELLFAALRELLRPVADRIDTLPGPQADAIRGAMGGGVAAGNRFLVGVGVLTLLSDLAERQPVLIAVDDAQWLDPASAEALAFVARRVAEESVLLVLTGHDDPRGGQFDGAEALRLDGLDVDSARRLVAERDPEISQSRLDRLLTVTGGNPLALTELTGAGSEFDPADGGPIPLGPRLRQAFDTRIAGLPADARTVLLVLAAQDGSDPVVARAAAATLGVPESGWDGALESGLVRQADGRIELRHWLIGAAIYDGAPAAERRAAHRALAAALEHLGDEDRLAWQLAALAESASEPVAAMLEDTAERAAARGGYVAAARTLRRAAVLTPDDAGAGRRLARAARLSWQGGDAAAARELLAQAKTRAGGDVVTRASGGWEGLMDLALGDNLHAREMLLRDAELVEPEAAAELRHLAVRAEWAMGAGFDDAKAAELMAELDVDNSARPWRVPPPALAVAMGRGEQADEVMRRAIPELRARGDVAWLANVLAHLATLEVLHGRWDEAAADATEALRLNESTESPNTIALADNALGWLAAMRGETDAAREWSERALDASRGRHAGSLVAVSYWNLGVTALGAGDTETAYRYLAAIATPGDEAEHPVYAALSAAEAAEAAVRLGRPDAARTHLDIVASWRDRTHARWAVADAACCAAMLASDEDAEADFETALAASDPALRPYKQARIQLLYGEWLRRVGRRADARLQLRSALATFERLGAEPWVVRARAELELAGERRERARASNNAPLTPQELRIARLAATGATNREIAAQLFISPRTVGHHLSRIFAKLGLAGREDLAAIDFEHGMRLTG